MTTLDIGTFVRTTLKRRTTILAACAVLVAGAVCYPLANAVTGRILSDEDRAKMEAAALYGDGKAAWQLAEHYYLIDKDTEGKYWHRIAIENGDPSSIQSYAARLWMSGGPRNCPRALYLYDKVIVRTGAFSPELLKELRAQHNEMKKELKKCMSQACSVEVDGAWCD